MTNTKEISGFGEWIIPSGEGVVHMEGAPSDEERNLNYTRTAIRRKKWNPSEKALEVSRKLKILEGNWVRIQLWDKLMLWDEEEGANPFECNLIKVYLKTIKEMDRDFIQLFIEFKDYRIVDLGYLSGSPIYEGNFDPGTGTYTYNCSTFYSVTEK